MIKLSPGITWYWCLGVRYQLPTRPISDDKSYALNILFWSVSVFVCHVHWLSLFVCVAKPRHPSWIREVRHCVMSYSHPLSFYNAHCVRALSAFRSFRCMINLECTIRLFLSDWFIINACIHLLHFPAQITAICLSCFSFFHFLHLSSLWNTVPGETLIFASIAIKDQDIILCCNWSMYLCLGLWRNSLF